MSSTYKMPGIFNCEEFVFRPEPCPEYIEEEFDRRSGMPYQEWAMEQRYKKKRFEKKHYYKQYRKHFKTITDGYLGTEFDQANIISLFFRFQEWLHEVSVYVLDYGTIIRPALFWMDDVYKNNPIKEDESIYDYNKRIEKTKNEMIEEADGCYIEAKFVKELVSPFVYDEGKTVKRPYINIIIGEGQKGYPWDIIKEAENELKNNQ